MRNTTPSSSPSLFEHLVILAFVLVIIGASGGFTNDARADDTPAEPKVDEAMPAPKSEEPQTSESAEIDKSVKRPEIGTQRWVEIHGGRHAMQLRLCNDWQLSMDRFYDLQKQQQGGRALGKFFSLWAKSKKDALRGFTQMLGGITRSQHLVLNTTPEEVELTDGQMALVFTAPPRDPVNGVGDPDGKKTTPLWAQTAVICVEHQGVWFLYAVGVLCHYNTREEVSADLKQMLATLVVVSTAKPEAK